MIDEAAVIDFIRSWVFVRTGSVCAENDDLFSDFRLDSLDFAELLDDVYQDLSLELDPAKIKNWNDVKSIRGLVKQLEERRTVDE